MTTDSQRRTASIKETGEELSQEDWQRFDRATAELRASRPMKEPYERGESVQLPPMMAPPK